MPVWIRFILNGYTVMKAIELASKLYDRHGDRLEYQGQKLLASGQQKARNVRKRFRLPFRITIYKK